MTALKMRVLLVAGLTTLSILLLFGVFSKGVTPEDLTEYANQIVSQVRPNAPAEKLAYLTLLTDTMANMSDPDPEHDRYFVATRILGYQLMHQPNTKTRRKIPFVVMVTDDISFQKQKLLRDDGATVIKVDYLRADTNWIVAEMPEWADVMTKLRAWELTQYSRIAFLDGDMILNRCLDGIFDDPATRTTLRNTEAKSLSDEGEIPEHYVFASIAEAKPFHAYPPTIENGDFKDPDYFNAGFFIFSPSKTMFKHYTKVMNLENRWDPKYAEQNLLNYVQRRDGKIPWQDMDIAWNIRFPSMYDKEAGVASLHDKWWRAHMDRSLQPYYESIRWRMEGFYEARDRDLSGLEKGEGSSYHKGEHPQ